MSLTKHYNPGEVEQRLRAYWQEQGVFRFSPDETSPVYSIDTPPATVSGNLHLGHVYSYTHADLIARFWRMKGYNVFYPMGFDDNGLPTERLVEKKLGITARQVGRQAFIDACLKISKESERDYQDLWQRLGLSIDWRYTYRTIDDNSRRISQLSFTELYKQGLAYRKEAPAIWCPECRTSIAQAELSDLKRASEMITLDFILDDGRSLPIATTRPELLPACVAVFVHPDDMRYKGFAGHHVTVPIFGQRVMIYEDPAADPQKGTGAVMCCTFGDTTDVAWWYTYQLPLIQAIDRNGDMTSIAGDLQGMPLQEARKQIKQILESSGKVLSRQVIPQSIRVHERCDTPVEYIVVKQWFIRVLDFKERLLNAGGQVHWYPDHMKNRYLNWVENLNWDWCISRQRYFGVPFPIWYCQGCGEILLAQESELPVDPAAQEPQRTCPQCGSSLFIPETDILDTWATSSMTPQIVGQWREEGSSLNSSTLYERVYPFSLRPQAHEIIRTWAFYTIVKSQYHFNVLPWKDVLISGWGIAGEGMGKISKSRGGGPLPPLEMLQRYSADAVRYWAASSGPGKDSLISEEKIQNGAKLVTKLWNVARFSEPFLKGYSPNMTGLLPADRWILSQLQRLIRRVTELLEEYDYATSKSEIEAFFWTVFADNYLEMSKQRLYDSHSLLREGSVYTLHQVLSTLLKLMAPFLPFVTEEIFLNLFAENASRSEYPISIHRSQWPVPDPSLEDSWSETIGEVLVDIATHIRRYKSEHNLPLGRELVKLQLAVPARSADQTEGEALRNSLIASTIDLRSVTRAKEVEVTGELESSLLLLHTGSPVSIAIKIEN